MKNKNIFLAIILILLAIIGYGKLSMSQRPILQGTSQNGGPSTLKAMNIPLQARQFPLICPKFNTNASHPSIKVPKSKAKVPRPPHKSNP